MPDGATTPLVSLDHEELVIRRGRRSGLYTIVAVHSTALGPALGGCRMWRYQSSADAARDALRLSRAMTFKAAAAGVPLGGGKGVIATDPGNPPKGRRRRDALLDFADAVNTLDGRYVTAEDVGTSARDMAVLAEGTKHVTGLARSKGGSGDPSPFTAQGVEAAMRACCLRRFGSPELKGRSVSVVGVGRVGSRLAKRLARAGAKLIVSDIDESRRELAKSIGAKWADPSAALLAEVDIVAPCALGGAIDQVVSERLRCQVVCGSANNQLAHDGLAEDLAAHGILFAPDFIASAGGLINISVELERYDAARARRRVAGIEETMGEVLDRAEAESVTPLEAAYAVARVRLAGATVVMTVSPVGRAIAANLAEIVGGTPMVTLTRVAPDCGAELVAKLEAYNPGGSVKDRIGVSMIDAAEAEGRIEPGRTTIVEATSGNTGIALAFVCAARGYELVLAMPQGMSREREGLLRLYGARVEITESMGGMNEAVEAAQRIAASVGDAFIPDQFSNPANPEIHRRTTAEEIWRDMDGKVDALVSGVGTGGTVTGAGERLKELNPDLLVVAVEPASSPVLSGGRPGPHKIQGIGAGFVPPVFNPEVVDEILQVSDEDAIQTARDCARTEGVLVGISCGAALWGAIEVGSRPDMRGKRIAVIMPDSGERYVSTPFFAPD